MTLSDTATAELWETFRAGGGGELIGDAVRLVFQEFIEAEATEAIGAGRYERGDQRSNERNGHRPRLLATQAGDVELRIPKLRRGSFMPSVIEPRRRIDRTLHAVVMEAYVAGVSTRSVDELVAALGAESGISKSEVSRICAGLDEMVDAFRSRHLGHVEFPYVFLDATYLKVRNSVSQPISMAMVVATGVTADGNREILGCDLGDSESEAFWTQFLGSLRARGLAGVRLVVADTHAGLAAAADRALQGASRQRCRVHFVRNLLALVPRTHQHMAAALFRTVFAQPDADAVSSQWDDVAERLEASFPKAGPLMADAKHEVLAFAAFPKAHRQKTWSTNPIERINKEIKRWASPLIVEGWSVGFGLFVVGWAGHVECAVEPAGVVPVGDPSCDVSAGLAACGPVSPADELPGEGGEERLCDGVVQSAADSSGGAGDAELVACPGEVSGGVLGAFVGVEDHPAHVAASGGHGHLDGGQGQRGGGVSVRGGEPHDASAEQVDHRGEVHLALPRGDLFEVPDPALVRGGSGEVASDQVLGGSLAVGVAGPPALLGACDEALAGHGCLHRLARHSPARSPQLHPDARDP